MDRLAVIGVPSSAGARHTGQDRAPAAFRTAGLVERLETKGLMVSDLGDLPRVVFRPDTGNPKQQNLGLVREVAEQVAAQVNRAVEEQARPIVLGGDCTITLGVCAGLVMHFPKLGLLYFDGDIDLNTPDDTSSGVFDGMVMAHMIGRGAKELSRLGPRYPLMPEENIVLFGYNPEAGWIDPGEAQQLDRCSMVRLPIGQIRGRAEEAAGEAVAQLDGKIDGLLVHFDVDVIDAAEFPVADVLHSHGLGFQEAVDALGCFVRHPKFVGLVITEFNADRDREGSYARQLVHDLTEALASGRNHWR
jgi:arginase